MYLQLVGNIPVHKPSASASWLKILTDVHYRDDKWFVVIACKAKKLKICLEKSWARDFLLHGNPSKYPEVEMKSWNPKLKFFPSIQDDKVSSWLHTMIVEHKNNGKETVIIFYIPKWALRTQRQVLQVKAFHFQKPGSIKN